MRQVKFKSWVKGEDEGMLEGYGFIENDQPSECSRRILLEFTGFKDAHDKEIFEGDIVETLGIRFVIRKEIGMFVMCSSREITEIFPNTWNDHIYPLGQLYWHNDDTDYVISNLEVAGNVFENPELLEEN